MSRSPCLLAALVSLSVAAACAPEVDPMPPASPDASREGGGGPDDSGGTLVLELVRPDRGGSAGGTTFEIFGRGFTDGARVTFVLMGDELDATEVAVQDSTRLTGRTPATGGRTGRASVRVSLPSGRTATLPNVFLYVDGDDAGPDDDMGLVDAGPPPPVDMGPPPPVDMGPPPPADMGPPPPVDMGPPPPVDMGPPRPVDMGPPPPVDMGPVDAGPRDMGPVDMGPPPPLDMGPADLGPPDLGPPDTGPADTGPRDTGPADAGPRVTVCLVEQPVATDPLAGSFVNGYLGPLADAPRATRIQVTVPGLTEAPGQAAGLVVELGRGVIPAPGSDDISGWAWFPTMYITDAGSIETYFARLLAPTDPGEYGIAARVTVPGSPPVYCDLDGVANGFSASMTGVFTVVASGSNQPNFCHVQFPTAADPALTGHPGTLLSSYVYGWVYEPGVTEAVGQGTGIFGEVGYGPAGSYPSSARWTWFSATYNTDPAAGPNNDEYWDNPGRILAPGVGSYIVAYRFRTGSGPWLYCDSRDTPTGGSDNGFHPGTAPRLTVTP